MSVRNGVRVPTRPAPAGSAPPVADPPRPRAGGEAWLLPPWSRAPLLPFASRR